MLNRRPRALACCHAAAVSDSDAPHCVSKASLYVQCKACCTWSRRRDSLDRRYRALVCCQAAGPPALPDSAEGMRSITSGCTHAGPSVSARHVGGMLTHIIHTALADPRPPAWEISDPRATCLEALNTLREPLSRCRKPLETAQKTPQPASTPRPPPEAGR